MADGRDADLASRLARILNGDAERDPLLVRRGPRRRPHVSPRRIGTADRHCCPLLEKPGRGACPLYSAGAVVAEAVDAACCAAGQPFEDPFFPQAPRSIDPSGNGFAPSNEAGQWARAAAPGARWVGAGPGTAHVRQGAISDCWLMSILGSLCLRAPDRVQRLFATPQATQSGVCAIRLFIPPLGVWRAIVIDDAIPVDAAGAPCFARCTAALPPWPALVEKAFAKLLGGYARLAGASGWAPTLERAMTMLTAGPAHTLRLDRAGQDGVAAELRALSRAGGPPWIAAAVWQCRGPEDAAGAVPRDNHHAVAIEGVEAATAADHGGVGGKIRLLVRNDVSEADAAAAQHRFPAFPAAGRSCRGLTSAMAHMGSVAVCRISEAPWPVHSALCRGEWSPPLAGGYGSPASPQFLLQLGPDSHGAPTSATSGPIALPALRVELHPAEDALRDTDHAAFLRVAPAGPEPTVPLRTLRGLESTATSAYRRGAPAMVEIAHLPATDFPDQDPCTSFLILPTWGKTGAGASAPFALCVRAARPIVALRRLQ